MARRIVVISDYFKLLDRFRPLKHVRKKAERAATIACRNAGQDTKNFARKIRSQSRFLLKHGFLPPYRRGNHSSHTSLLDNEAVRIKIHAYLATLKVGTITPRKLRDQLIKTILPTLDPFSFNSTVPRVSIRTATRWLYQLGYQRHRMKKGVYVDGHERPDVRAARDVFLKKMEELQPYVFKFVFLLK